MNAPFIPVRIDTSAFDERERLPYSTMEALAASQRLGGAMNAMADPRYKAWAMQQAVRRAVPDTDDDGDFDGGASHPDHPGRFI